MATLVYSTTSFVSEYTGRAMSYNTADSTDYDMQQAFMNMILTARINSAVGTYTGPQDTTTNLPTEIPSGSSYVEFLWDLGLINDHPHPITDTDHVIRHNLDALEPGTYTIQVLGASTVSSAANRTIMNIGPRPGVVLVRINGPTGSLPSGWFIEVVKSADEALYDETSLHEAQQIFRPEFLSFWQSLETDHIRFMKQTGTENGTFKTAAQMTKRGMCSYRSRYNLGGAYRVIMPVEDAVSLCNYLECGLYWTTGHRLNHAAHDYLAQYISNNLDPSLPVYMEHFNEAWNFLYTGLRYFGAIFNRRFMPPGIGTLTTVAGSNKITATDVDLTTVFDAKIDRVTLGNYTYDVDVSSITAGSIGLAYSMKAEEDVTNGFYWATDNINHEEGYVIEATKAAKRWVDVFEANGDETRLTTTIGIRTSGGGILDRLMNPKAWVQPREADALAPQTVFKAAATNVYFGAGSFGWSASDPIPVAAAVRDAHIAKPGSAAPLLREYFMGRHGSYSTKQDLPSIRREVKSLRADCQKYGLKLISYEAGQHVVSSGPFSLTTNGAFWSDIYNEWILFMNSTEAEEVFEEMVNIQLVYNDGPVNKFQSIQEWSQFGTFSEFPYYGYSGDTQTTTHDALRAKGPFWRSTDPVRGALGTPKLFLTAGVSQTVDLNDYFSVNATSFQAESIPAGMTLNTSTGFLFGMPNASSGTHVFSGSNSIGSDNVTLEIVVS